MTPSPRSEGRGGTKSAGHDLQNAVLHPLAAALRAAAAGVFPDGDTPVRVVPPPPHLAGAVVTFSGCTYIAADVDLADVEARLGPDPLVGPVRPSFLEWLAAAVGGHAHNNEIVVAGTGTGSVPASLAREPRWQAHERARHGAVLRREIDGWSYAGGAGIVLVGKGLVDRWELAYEASPGTPPGTGRALAAAALGTVPAGEPLFAQIAPGHARSIRAVLAAGYRPIGGEVLITHRG